MGPCANSGASVGVVETRWAEITAARRDRWPSRWLVGTESRALLDRLLDWATRPLFVVHHDWRPGDLVTWDNTGMVHRAMPFEPTSPRLMHRTTLVGEEAVA